MRAEPDRWRVGKSHLKCENATPGLCRGAMPDGALPHPVAWVAMTWARGARKRCRYGEMAERFKAPVLKTGEGSFLPWVRIPLSPPITYNSLILNVNF